MKCPYCATNETKVVDKRNKDDEGIIRRRRECLKCHKRFTTYERIENVDLNVVKKDGSTQQFSREKLKKSIRKSFSRENVGMGVVSKMVDEIEMNLLNRDSTEIDSTEIGKMVLEKLKDIDLVAYMRFASVYKDFKSLEDFRSELKKLL